MAAALPHIDELVSGHSLAALEEVVRAIGRDERARTPVNTLRAQSPRLVRP